MRNLFSYDSPVTQVLAKVCFCCCLNGLWLILSLPIVTMGAATTALYYVSFKLVRDTEGAVFRQFFQAFKDNFVQATKLWLALLVIGIFLGVDSYVLVHLRRTTTGTMAIIWTLLLAIIIAAFIVYAIIMVFVFPLLSYFENDNITMVLNAFRMGVRYLFATIVILGIHFLVLYIVINLFTPLAVFGEGLCAMLSAYLLSGIFYDVSGEKAAYEAELRAQEAAEDDTEE